MKAKAFFYQLLKFHPLKDKKNSQQKCIYKLRSQEENKTEHQILILISTVASCIFLIFTSRAFCLQAENMITISLFIIQFQAFWIFRIWWSAIYIFIASWYKRVYAIENVHPIRIGDTGSTLHISHVRTAVDSYVFFPHPLHARCIHEADSSLLPL